MRKILVTTIHQETVKVLDEKDAPETFAKNLPPGGTDKWQLVEYSNGQRIWHPVHRYTFTTPELRDHTKVDILVKE